jgi:hypothetical protein
MTWRGLSYGFVLIEFQGYTPSVWRRGFAVS